MRKIIEKWEKRHLSLEKDKTKVWCSHCKKVVEERSGGLPDYAMFMGSVWVKQNLPCIPYEGKG